MMNQIRHIIHGLTHGIHTVAFPNVCLCCGLETTRQERPLCSFCKEERFEDANPENKFSSSGVILPEAAAIQHALWQFDKGGLLQDLMHYLKYERLTGVGLELGALSARRMVNHPGIAALLARESAILVPVPLHYLKFRKRGFNQAFLIARGINEVLDIPVCSLTAVIRRKNTRSQTGFSLEKRMSNVKDAFRIRKPVEFAGKMAIIVDDVFTTGATTFELAGVLQEAGCREIIIATAAQA